MIVSAGCAKFPATSSAQNIHLIFTMSVAGHIQDGSQSGEAPYIYIIAVNPSTDLFPISTGPEPVISQPWGNGFVAGGATHFIQYALGQVSPYTVYQFTDSSLMAWVATGVPINTSTTTNKIQFEIDISQIKPSDVSDVSTLQSVQVNFLTMNRRPQGGDTGSKVWDALGNSGDPNSINDYVRIPLTSSRIYTNADFQDLEPQGDCPDPNLDIVDWSVEVRKP
ncbi:MAG TPA: hypothetical protein VHE55_13595 [Fimbriimonadaceae bacterium]|nr:hypothetical protein [Fimbriimonadaceae bacterium]